MDSAQDGLPCGILTFGDGGRLEFINAPLCSMLGYQREELLGEHFQVLFTAGGRVFYHTHLFPLLKLHGAVEEIFFSLRSKSGKEVPFLLNGKRETAEGGFLFCCVLMRMQRRGHFENELLNAKKSAQAANKAKDEFLAALSHELRTPLTPVLMTSAAMEMNSEFSPEVRRQAEIIRRNAELEARLIDDLLDHTRIKHGKLRLSQASLDMHSLLLHTEEIIRSEGDGKRVAVTFENHAANHHVDGDTARLQQVFWNIIKNSVKFTPEGGLVRVVTSNDAAGNLIVRITDTGIGIPSDALERIFNTFEQGSVSTRTFGGLGLGLAITKGIVVMHGGSIHAESEGVGYGSTFVVSLKTVLPPAIVPFDPASKREPRPNKLRMLIVEDHQSTREVLTSIMRRSGHEVHAAGTGEEALQIARSVKSFSVLLSDLGLPDMSGFELVPQIQRLQPGIKAIALSGYGMEEDVQQAKAAGFSAHLVKPVPLEQLRSLLEQIDLM